MNLNNDVKQLVLWLESQTQSPNKSQANLAKKCFKELNKAEREFILDIFLNHLTDESKINPNEFLNKLNAFNIKNYNFKRVNSWTKKLSRWISNLFYDRISSHQVRHTVRSNRASNSLTTINKQLSYAEFLDASSPVGDYVIHHRTTNPQSVYPQEHLGIKPLKNGFHIGLTEAKEKDNPFAWMNDVTNKIIGMNFYKTAGEALTNILESAILDKQYPHPLNHDRDTILGFLEVEVIRSAQGGTNIKWVDQNSTSSLFIVNAKGQVLYPDKEANRSKNQVHQLHFNEPVFLILASNGLTKHFKNNDALLNALIPKAQELNCFTIGNALKEAAIQKAESNAASQCDMTLAVIRLNE